MSLFQTLGFIANHPLNRHRKSQALFGFLKWQIGSRMVPGPVVFEWVNGARAIIRSGETGITQNVYCGLHDFADMAYLLHVLEPDDLFVDIGANVGSYTILACAAKGARGYCFEPVPSTYRRLLDNLAINNLSSRVIALNIGLSNKESELVFTSGDNCVNHVVTDNEKTAQSVTVKVSSLDTVLSGDCPSVMKIDVEGFESAVLDGAHATLANSVLHSVIMELNGSGVRYGFDEDSILRKMFDYGFSTYEYEPFSREIRPLHGKNSAYGNTLFLRGENRIKEKITNAPLVRLGTNQF